MAVENGDVIRVTMRYNIAGGQRMENVYYCRFESPVPAQDGAALGLMEDWMESIHTGLNPLMDSNITLGQCDCDIVHLEGVYDPDPKINTSKIVVDRHLGTITPAFSPSQSGDQYANVVAAVGVAKTTFPKVHGRKAFGGLSEFVVGEGVLTAGGLSNLATAVAAWIGGMGLLPFYHEGVLSHSKGEFVPFNGTGSVTNNPGTNRRRRIGRGT